jgi:hypothetical protein
MKERPDGGVEWMAPPPLRAMWLRRYGTDAPATGVHSVSLGRKILLRGGADFARLCRNLPRKVLDFLVFGFSAVTHNP